MSSRKGRRARERELQKALKKGHAEDDTQLVQGLINLTGLDEITAAKLIGEQNCRVCGSRLTPMSVLTDETNDWSVSYACLRCQQAVMYHIKTAKWTKMRQDDVEKI